MMPVGVLKLTLSSVGLGPKLGWGGGNFGHVVSGYFDEGRIVGVIGGTS